MYNQFCFRPYWIHFGDASIWFWYDRPQRLFYRWYLSCKKEKGFHYKYVLHKLSFLHYCMMYIYFDNFYWSLISNRWMFFIFTFFLSNLNIIQLPILVILSIKFDVNLLNVGDHYIIHYIYLLCFKNICLGKEGYVEIYILYIIKLFQ